MVDADFIKETGMQTLLCAFQWEKLGGEQVRCLDLEGFKSMSIV
jgi:hypothetical protein